MPVNYSHFVSKDIEALVDFTLKKRKKIYKQIKTNRGDKKYVPEYDVFPTMVYMEDKKW